MRSMDIGGYRHNFEGFNEKFTSIMSISNERTITLNSAHVNLVVDSPFSYLCLLLKISNLLVYRSCGYHLNSFKNSFNEPCKYGL